MALARALLAADRATSSSSSRSTSLLQLNAKHEASLALYRERRGAVAQLREALRAHVGAAGGRVGGGGGEEAAKDEEGEGLAAAGEDALCSRLVQEWIDDEGTIFRTLKKHKFRTEDAYDALLGTLRWRASVLRRAVAAAGRSHAGDEDGSAAAAPFVRCLPRAVRDKAGRPVVLVTLAALPASLEETQRCVLCAFEDVRRRLQRRDERRTGSGRIPRGRQRRRQPLKSGNEEEEEDDDATGGGGGVGGALQCLVMVDFKAAQFWRHSMVVELVPWYVREAAPHFPGICAAVMMMNYVWTYAGAYNLVKPVLPSSVLERITFPTEAELLEFFEKSRLPREYGGDFGSSPSPTPSPSSPSENGSPRPCDPPRGSPGRSVPLSPPPPSPDGQLDAVTAPAVASAPHHGHQHQHHLQHQHQHLPAMSLLNPFYGYPALARRGSSVPELKGGRRRKRDLVRTLGMLWLAKLKRMADRTWLWIAVSLVCWFVVGLRRRWRRRGR